MLTIKDLSTSKELDSKALTEVRGGSDIYNNAGQFSSQAANGGLVAVAQGEQNQFVSNYASDYYESLDNFVGLGAFGIVAN